jgi:hypothetical protein
VVIIVFGAMTSKYYSSWQAGGLNCLYLRHMVRQSKTYQLCSGPVVNIVDS